MFEYVIWDMNGTLIDDVETAVLAVNDGFAKVGVPATDVSEYRRNMDMPIYKYYEKHADLTKIPMSFFSKEYLEGYERYKHKIKPSEHALYTVRRLHRLGCAQCVISSFEQGRLLRLAQDFGFAPFMEGILGADDEHCLSKIERGKAWIREKGADPEKVLVIGDMTHDYDMAKAMGVHCVLYEKGHQAKELLDKCGVRVIDDLRDLLK